MPYLAASVSVMDYNADPTGVADSTSAFNQAVAAVNAAGGGAVTAPAGTFKITPSGSPAVGISFMGTGAVGYQGVRLIGAGNDATILTRNGNGVLVQFSGPSTSPSTGSTHTRYCSLESIGINGNNGTGAAIQCYYADNLLFRDLFVNANGDIIMDCVEFWDSRILASVFGGSGSTTASSSTPNIYLRNSSAASGFGSSAGTTNNIVIDACRFEAFLTGALWIAQGTGSSSGPNTIFVKNCKMETSQLNGGAHLSVDSNTRATFVDGLYIYSGGFFTGFSTAQDTISFSGQDSALTNVLISDGSPATIANGVTVNSTVAGITTAVRNVYGTYTTAPTGKHVNIGTTTGHVLVDNCHFNGTDPSILNQITEWIASSSGTNVFGASVGGDTIHRFTSNAKGDLSWGPGNASADVVMSRTATGVMSFTSGILDPQVGTKTTTAAAVLTPTFANGTAAQLSDTTRDYMVYLDCTTSGTATTIAIGPTNTTANTLVASASFTAGTMYSFRLPAGWWVKWSGTTTAFATQTAIGC
jgi:hypothetical protein